MTADAVNADDFDAILEDAVRRTGVARYRWLCSASNPHPPPNSAADYRRWIAGRGWEATGPPLDLAAILREAKAAAEDHTPDPHAPPPCGGCR